MSDTDRVVATTQSNGREKFNNDSDPSTSTQIPIPSPSIPPPRSTFKSIVLVLTVTFAMILNVGCLRVAEVAKRTQPIIIDCELFSIYNCPTNDRERVGIGRSTSPVDRIGLFFEFGV